MDLKRNLGSGIVIIILEQEIDLHHGKKDNINVIYSVQYTMLF